MNKVYSINGPVVKVRDTHDFSMLEMVRVGKNRLVGEVIGINSDETTIQVYESTTGMRPGEPVEGTGAPVSVTLGPGIISNIFDGIERPLRDIADIDGAFPKHLICEISIGGFLEKLGEIFNWEKYERSLIGNKDDNGEHPVLKRHAVSLSKWFKGMSIQEMIKDSIEYKKTSGQKVYMPDHSREDYRDCPEHNNQIAADVLSEINDVILFSFSNYFMAFSSAYKDFIGQEAFGNDWYEYVEYGSVNPLTIMLQRNGFSREAATYITDNRNKYVKDTLDGQRLRRSLLDCEKTTVQREAQPIEISMPELYLKNQE